MPKTIGQPWGCSTGCGKNGHNNFFGGVIMVLVSFFFFFFFPALSCPPHSHYELCTRTCDFTCASLSVPAPCSWTCFEGCQCDDGYLFDGEACVSLEQCGCMHQGRYFKVRLTIKAWHRWFWWKSG